MVVYAFSQHQGNRDGQLSVSSRTFSGAYCVFQDSQCSLWGPVETWKPLYSLCYYFHFLWRWSSVCGVCGSSFTLFHLCLFHTFDVLASCFEFHPCDDYFKYFLCKLPGYCKVISGIQQAPCGLNVRRKTYARAQNSAVLELSVHPWTCEWQLKAPCRVIPKPPIPWKVMVKNGVLSGCAGGPLAVLSLPFSCLPLLACPVIWVAEKLLA